MAYYQQVLQRFVNAIKAAEEFQPFSEKQKQFLNYKFERLPLSPLADLEHLEPQKLKQPQFIELPQPVAEL